MANIIQAFPKGSGSASGGAVFSYIDLTKTPLNSDWLLKEPGGETIEPTNDLLYIILSDGEYKNSIYRFDETTNKYVLVQSADGGVVFALIDSTKTELASDWLKTESNVTITPKAGLLYLILSDGDYKNSFYRFDSTTNKYVLVQSNEGGGAIFSYIDSTKTALDPDWLKKADNSPITPKENNLYLILTVGEYYNSFYRFNATTNKYVLVISAESDTVFATIDSTKTALDSDWLKNTANETIIPKVNKLYIITSDGENKNNLYGFNATTNKYYLISKPGASLSDNGTGVAHRDIIDLIDFDVSDNEQDNSTEVAPHELTAAEMHAILDPLPIIIPDPLVIPQVYAFQIDMSQSNPALAVTPYVSEWGCDNKNFTPAHMDFSTGKFDYGSWSGNEFFFPKPCMLKYDGTVDYYLDPDDYTKKADGTASDVANASYEGNAMVEFPTIYFKRWQVNDKAYCVISDKKLSSDFQAFAHMDVNGDVADKTYIAAYDGALVSGKLRSLSGYTANTATSTTANRIMTYTTRQEEINYAKANNVRTDCEGWSTWHKADRDMVNDLLILFGMNLNTQATFGRGRDTGYVSISNNGIVATGSMNTKGLFWGENAGAAGVKVFGIENWWGNYWKAVQGLISANGTQKVKMTYGKEDGTDVYGYNFDGTGYRVIDGATPTGTNGGYINGYKYSRQGLVPYQVSGTDSTYLCDGMWFNNGQNNYSLAGGSSGDGLLCGAFYVTCFDLSSVRNWHVGAALTFKKLKDAQSA